MTQERMLKEWIDGNIAGAGSESRSQAVAQGLHQLEFVPSASPAGCSQRWPMGQQHRFRLSHLGMKANAKKTVMAINTASNGC